MREPWLLLLFVASLLLVGATPGPTAEQVRTCQEAVRTFMEKTERKWGIDTGRDGLRIYNRYEHTFGPALGPSKDFQSFFAERRNRGLSNHVLDLFGSCRLTETLDGLDSATGVRLKPDSVPDPKRPVLAGDLFSSPLKPIVRQRMLDLDIRTFDVIVIRPVGVLTESLNIYHEKLGVVEGTRIAIQEYWKVVSQAYDLLSSHDGIILAQFPYWGVLPDFEETLHQKGIQVSVFGGTIKSARTSSSAEALPELDLSHLRIPSRP
jgi:hypothetical protein